MCTVTILAISDLQGPLARSTLMKQTKFDHSLNELSIDASTVQIGCAEPPLTSFLFVLSVYGECIGGYGFTTVLSTITLQAMLDSVRGELSSDTQTLISYWEILRSVKKLEV